jgi:hypothetical protein
VATDLSAGTSDTVVHGCLLSLSGRLESLWREAAERLQDSPPQSVERERWGVAAARLTDALSTLERYAGGMDRTLGRRDWVARRPTLYGVPTTRVPST